MENKQVQNSKTKADGLNEKAPNKVEIQKSIGVFDEKLPQIIPCKNDIKAIQKNKDFMRIDKDGLPYPGVPIYPEENYAYVHDLVTDKYAPYKFGGDEIGMVDKVTVIEGDNPGLTHASIRFRIHRRPEIGDKFASRAGQKGILGSLWPDEDMPFSELTGMRPDLIINPHAFPSRMTMGMLIECLVSKSASLKGTSVDCTAFRKCDHPDLGDPVEEFGEYLERSGFSYDGNETLISGITGEVMQFRIYMGIVYYQRLRHMVADKIQCRSAGKVDSHTRQPVKGRKVGGGIRLGEMERDALIAHGSSFTIQERLNFSSDRSSALICSKCKSMPGVMFERLLCGETERDLFKNDVIKPKRRICLSCGSEHKEIRKVDVPHIFQLLVAELASMNIKVNFTVKRNL